MKAPLRSWARGIADRPRPDTWSFIIALGLSLAMLVVLGRVGQLQARPSADLVRHADDRVSRAPEPGLRGDILDRRGRVLAASRFGHRVFIDPVRFPSPPEAAMLRLADATGVPMEEIARRLVPKIAENERREHFNKQLASPPPSESTRVAPGAPLLAAVIPAPEPASSETSGVTEDPLAPGATPEEPAQPRPLPLVRYVSLGGVLDAWRVNKVRELKIPGVHLELRGVRGYPADDLTASLVGLVGVDHNGLLGVELEVDDFVGPTPGELRFVRDARMRPLWVNRGGYVPPQRGQDVRLALDLEIQRIVTQELERGVADADAAGGRCVVMDPMTGEILAMVDLIRPPPDAVPYDWDNPWIDAPGQGPRPRYTTIRQDPRTLEHPALARNRCVEDVYEPGSTFKSFMWSATTNLGLADPDEVVNTEHGKWRTIYGRPIADVVRRATMTWAEVLVHSSNIGMAKVTRRMDDKQMRKAVLDFGFGRRTELGLPGESPGIVTPERAWSKYTQTSVAMGHEIAVTPVQMVRAFAAFARSGKYAGSVPRLRLFAAARVNDGSDGAGVDPGTPVIAPAIAELTRRTMRGVVDNLDRRMAARKDAGDDPALPHYDLFGKSGTAEIPLGRPPKGKKRPRGSDGYFPNQYNSSFIAGGPLENPRLVVIVVIDDPGPGKVAKREHYGSVVAGPVVRRIMGRALAYLGVPESPQPEDTPPASRQAGR